VALSIFRSSRHGFDFRNVRMTRSCSCSSVKPDRWKFPARRSAVQSRASNRGGMNWTADLECQGKRDDQKNQVEQQVVLRNRRQNRSTGSRGPVLRGRAGFAIPVQAPPMKRTIKTGTSVMAAVTRSRLPASSSSERPEHPAFLCLPARKQGETKPR